MFKKNKFEAMIVEKGMTKEELSKELGISRATLIRKIKNDGSFTRAEINKMLSIFGKDNLWVFF